MARYSLDITEFAQRSDVYTSGILWGAQRMSTTFAYQILITPFVKCTHNFHLGYYPFILSGQDSRSRYGIIQKYNIIMATVIGQWICMLPKADQWDPSLGLCLEGLLTGKDASLNPRMSIFATTFPTKQKQWAFKKLNKNKYFPYFKITNGFSLHLKLKLLLMATIPEPSASLTCAHMTFPFSH